MPEAHFSWIFFIYFTFNCNHYITSWTTVIQFSILSLNIKSNPYSESKTLMLHSFLDSTLNWVMSKIWTGSQYVKELNWAYLRWHIHVNHYIKRAGQNTYNLNFKDHVLTISDHQMLHSCPFPGKQIPLNRWPLDLLILFQIVLDN